MRKIDYVRARKLLKDPKNWSRGRYSVDRFGFKVLGGHPNATCWCALHACNLFAHERDHCRKELALAAKQLGFISITQLNDNGTHEQLIKMFDLAIGFCDGKTVLKKCVKVPNTRKQFYQMEGVSIAGATTGRFPSTAAAN